MADGSYLYVPYANRLNELYVGNDAKIDIGDRYTDSRLSYQINGEMVVTNLTQAATASRYVTYNQGTSTPGVFKFGTVTNKMNSSSGALFCCSDGRE